MGQRWKQGGGEEECLAVCTVDLIDLECTGESFHWFHLHFATMAVCVHYSVCAFYTMQ